MSIKKCTKRNLISLSLSDFPMLGYNMLNGILGSAVDVNDGIHLAKKAPAEYKDKELLICTGENYGTHIDIFGEQAYIFFDLGEIKSIDTIAISCYDEWSNNYVIGEFELYASDSREDLFEATNKFAYECAMDKWEIGPRNNADWLYDVDGELRFFGIKVLKSNAIDDIIRLKHVGLYDKKNTERHCYAKENFPKNLLNGLEPSLVTDDVIFDDSKCFFVKNAHTFVFNLSKAVEIDKIWLISKEKCNVKYLDRNLEATEILYGRYKHEINIENPLLTENLEITVSGDACIELIGASSSIRKAVVNFKDEINDDFMGIGANVLPMKFMPESINSGYNPVYWELDERRILHTKPHVVRMWFQPDWLVETYDDYKSGNYNFDAPKMYSVYKYLDAFKKAGTEVLFNFGWKVSSHAQEWFSFEELPLNRRAASAPKELDLFAKCCAETLFELINNRGYDNIKYLTFYNEPNYAANPFDGDFKVIGYDRRDYWIIMLKKCQEEIYKKNINVKYWGAESNGTEEQVLDWINYFEEKEAPIDCHSIHVYHANSKSSRGVIRRKAPVFFEAVNENRNGKPFMITECGQISEKSDYNWDENHIQFLWEFTRAGASGALIWCLNDENITDPCSFPLDDPMSFWARPQIENGIEDVRDSFYEWAMLCHYVPNHCTSVSTTFDVDSDDYRVSAFKTNEGDFTVVLEVRESCVERNFEIQFDTLIGKKFYKHVFKRPCCNNGNAIIPPCTKELYVGDVLKDTVSEDYQAVVYTTIKPVGQIELPCTELFLSPGKSYYLSASTIDCSGELKWEITQVLGNKDDFILDLSGKKINVSKDATSGNMCALKVASVKNPKIYSIMIVKVK